MSGIPIPFLLRAAPILPENDAARIDFGLHRLLFASQACFVRKPLELVWKIPLLHGAQTLLVQNAAIAGDAPGTLSRLGA